MEDVQSSYLQTIPEDRSDASLPSPRFGHHPVAPSEAPSSVRGLAAGGEIASTNASVIGTVASPKEQATDDNGGEIVLEKLNPWQRFWRNKKYVAFVMVGVTLLLGMVLAIVFVTEQAEEGGGEEIEDSEDFSSPEEEPSVSTADPSTPLDSIDPERQAALDDMLSQLVTNDQMLQSSSTPQGRAREWMLTQDLLRDDVMDEGIARVHQRFALVSLYYATNGDSWTNSFLIPDMSECRWLNVACTTNANEQFVVQRVHLENNNLSGTLPDELLAALPNLQELILSDNLIEGSIPPAWFPSGQLPQVLFQLDLSKNLLQGPIPSGIWSVPSLRLVYLSNNELSGPVDSSPTTTILSTQLQDVWLYDNNLTGELPIWLPSAARLGKWIAWGNNIGGPLPSTLPPSLYRLDMSGNSLTGSIPPSLWLSQVRMLYLDGNELSGSLPPSSNTSAAMEEVWLHDNSLEGVIPEDFGIEWSSLRKLLLHGNPALTGSLGPSPDDGEVCSSWWTSVIRLEADCIQSGDGTVKCDCCTNDKCLV